MERATELSLMDELIALRANKSHYLDAKNGSVPVEHYSDPARFELERRVIFNRLPNAALHSSELEGPGAFARAQIGDLPVLITRDKQGEARAFLNVCRHRGAELVAEGEGCKHRFTCPYHAWTYASSGELIGAPHFDSGFPSLDKTDLSLKPLPAIEAMGVIWVVPTPDKEFDFGPWFGAFAEEVEALNLANSRIAVEDTIEIAANWKVLVEGGIEAYHFKVAHRDTIGPFFEDNLSSYQMSGPHMRSVLPRATLAKLPPEARDGWRLRDHGNLLYTFFPLTQFLVQQDHTIMIRSRPIAADRTELRIATLAPVDGPLAEGKSEEHWRQNHAITRKTLDEDFALGEGIQRGLGTGANARLTFGRFEGALTQFNTCIDDMLSSAD